MSLYSNYILPPLIDWAMNDKHLAPLRSALLSSAAGEVAEIGFGTGANLPFYPDSVKKLIAIEPSEKMLGTLKEETRLIQGRVRIDSFVGAEDCAQKRFRGLCGEHLHPLQSP